jgi:energy-coupling factor transport system substrate-specific component
MKESFMRAAFAMWANSRMIILAAVCAAIYGAALIAFKTAIPLIPGITELRVGNIFPIAFGLLFGPAGAWGTALGNFIGDLFGGTLGPGSIAGFVGNFLLGYLPYALWTQLFPWAHLTRDWRAGSWAHRVNFFLVTFISGAACAVVISAFVDFLGIVPYAVLSKIITLNNTVAGWIGLLLLVSVFNVTRDQFGLFWADVMDEREIGKPLAGFLGAWLVTIASVAGLLPGLIPGLPASTVGWFCTLFILVGSILL